MIMTSNSERNVFFLLLHTVANALVRFKDNDSYTYIGIYYLKVAIILRVITFVYLQIIVTLRYLNFLVAVLFVT